MGIIMRVIYNKLEILNSSQFFNSVELVCFVNNLKDEKFDLLNYTNKER